MKGKKKLILPLLLAGVTATTGYVAPVTQAVSAAETNGYTAETEISGQELKVKGFEDTYNIGDDIYLPEVTGANYEFKVTKGGKSVEIKTDNEGKKYFKAEYKGYYNIEVSTTDENRVKTVIDNLSVWVNKSDASIVLPVNSEYVIPAKVQKGETNLKIPAPSVLIGDDEEATEYKDLASGKDLKVSIYTPSGKEIELKANDDKTYFEVNEYTPEGGTAEKILSKAGTYTIVYKYLEGDEVVTTLDSNFQVVNSYDTSKMKLTMTLQDSMPTTGNINMEVSVPKVKVTESASSLDAINAHITVTVKNITTGHSVDFDYENYTFTPTEKGDYVVSYKADINVFNKTSEEITVGTTIKVSDKKGSTVMPTYDYVVNGEDLNKITTVNGTAVSDTEKLEDRMENIEYTIPSVVVLRNDNDEKEINGTNTTKYFELDLPAIYGTDNYDELSEITFTRSYRDPDGAVVTIDSGSITAQDSTLTKSTKVYLTKVGTYEFRYKSVDRANNTPGYKEYSVEVKESNTTTEDEMKTGKTKVELNIANNYISDKNAYLTFAVPTATDTYDKYIKVETTIELLNAEGNAIANTSRKLDNNDKNSDGKYSIDIKDLLDGHTDAKQIKVTAKAFIDASLKDTRPDFVAGTVTEEGGFIVVSKEKVLDVRLSSSDTSIATLALKKRTDESGTYETTTSWMEALIAENKYNDKVEMYGHTDSNDSSYTMDANGFAKVGEDRLKLNGTIDQSPFSQGDGIINLPRVEFVDNDENLSISVIIKDAYGNTVTPISNAQVSKKKNKDDDNYTYTVEGASFKLSQYGVYTITYMAEDVGGNITVQTFGVRVNDRTDPSIVVDEEDKFDDAIEVGREFTVPTAKLIKNGEDFDGNISWKLVNDTASCKVIGNTIVPMQQGSVKIVYYATDVAGNDVELDTDSFILTAKDTVAPVLELNEVFVGTLAWEKDENQNYQTITIPSANAYDGKFANEADHGYGKDMSKDVKISISGPNSTTPTVIYEDGYSKNITFRAEYEGTYTIKYTVTDAAGNTTTVTKELKLGDCEKPELTWDDEENDVPTTATLNETFTINTGKFTLSDEGGDTDEDYLLENLSITLTDPNGSTVSNSGSKVKPSWKIESTGTYTLKFVVKDKAGNTNPYSYKVEVPTEEVEEEKISPVVGTVLVVVAVVVLAGVVVYFVVSSKKKTPASSKKTKKAKK